jgi:hypothetical protein
MFQFVSQGLLKTRALTLVPYTGQELFAFHNPPHSVMALIII